MVPAAYLANSVPADVSTSVRDATTTLAPCPAKPKHIARPMPRLPPVTIATLSRNVIATPCAAPTLRAHPVSQAWYAILTLASKRHVVPGLPRSRATCLCLYGISIDFSYLPYLDSLLYHDLYDADKYDADKKTP